MALGKRIPNRKRNDLQENPCRFQWAREEAKTAEGFVDAGPKSLLSALLLAFSEPSFTSAATCPC